MRESERSRIYKVEKAIRTKSKMKMLRRKKNEEKIDRYFNDSFYYGNMCGLRSENLPLLRRENFRRSTEERREKLLRL